MTMFDFTCNGVIFSNIIVKYIYERLLTCRSFSWSEERNENEKKKILSPIFHLSTEIKYVEEVIHFCFFSGFFFLLIDYIETISQLNFFCRTMNFISSNRTTIPNISNGLTHDLLVIIGLSTVITLVVLLLCEIFFKLRQIYRTSEPSLPKDCFYEQLVKSNGNLCQCLTKFECVRSNCQISNRCVNYEQINERQKI